jgi:two-component system, chemotaxis family, protein-glutamate methylesterase/glutaminase
MSRQFDLVLIGGSAGAIEVLGKVLAQLTTRFSPAVAIVIHLPSEGPNVLHR